MGDNHAQDAAVQPEKPQRAPHALQLSPAPGLAGFPIAQLAETPGFARNPVLNGRGNGPVRAAVLQRLQQTRGNRAVQRLVGYPARPTLPAVQRQDAEDVGTGGGTGGGGGGTLAAGNCVPETGKMVTGPLQVRDDGMIDDNTNADANANANTNTGQDDNQTVQTMRVGLPTPMGLRVRLRLDGAAAVQRAAVFPAGVPRVVQRYTVPSNLACSALVGWLNGSSPYAPMWAETHPQYAFNGQAGLKWSGSGGKFTATIKGNTGLTVSIANAGSITDMPGWSPDTRPNQAAEVAAWNAMTARLDAHEGKHRTIAQNWISKLQTKWQAVNITATGSTAQEAKDAAVAQLQAAQKQWMADAQTDQSAIDPPKASEGIVLTCP